jgi:hypothetical protein
LANKKSNLICSKCRDYGFLDKRAVKNRVQLPKRANVVTLYDALDYAAKAFLRLHEDVIRFPPPPELEKALYQVQLERAYSEFTKFSLHTTKEIEAYESRQLNLLLERKEERNVIRRKNYDSQHKSKPMKESQQVNNFLSDMERPKESPIHVKLPENTGNITRMSILWLYGAIVFTVLRDMIQHIYQMSEEDDKWFASAVYSYYSFLVAVDDRKFVNPLRWLKILEDVNDNNGYSAAASRNYVVGTYCKRCKIEKKIFVPMEITGNNYDGRLCRECGGTEGLQRSVTREYIHNVIKGENSIKQRIIDFQENLQSYQNLEARLVNDIRSDPEITECFRESFDKYEKEAGKSSFHKSEHYFMGHYDASRKSKRRWCSLSVKDILAIEIDDPNYKKLIKDFLDSNENRNEVKAIDAVTRLCDRLAELNYPNEDTIFNKIGIDGELMHLLTM